MSVAKVNFKWYQLSDGLLKEPNGERHHEYGSEYLENESGFDSEIEAVNALVEFVGSEDYSDTSYVLIKSYIVCNRY